MISTRHLTHKLKRSRLMFLTLALASLVIARGVYTVITTTACCNAVAKVPNESTKRILSYNRYLARIFIIVLEAN